MRTNITAVYEALEQYVLELGYARPAVFEDFYVNRTCIVILYRDSMLHATHYLFVKLWYRLREPIHIFHLRLREGKNTKGMASV